MRESSMFGKITAGILLATVFLFPLFFLPVTPDFFSSNKMYLLAVAALLLILNSSIQIFFTKQITWRSNPVDKLLFAFSVLVLSSIIFNSPNKVQALLNPTFGLVTVASLCVLSLYLVRMSESVKNMVLNSLFLSSLISALISVIFFFQPLKSATLPTVLNILKAPYFTTFGNILDAAVFFGFVICLVISKILKKGSGSKSNKPLLYTTLLMSVIAMILSIYIISKPFTSGPGTVSPFTPYGKSWSAAVDTFKDPRTALLGVGVDNFSAIFVKEKDIAYNKSSQWQISAFNTASSTLLHIWTENGVIALVVAVLMLVMTFKVASNVSSKSNRNKVILPLLYVALVVLVLPPSVTTFFVLFFAVAWTANLYFSSKDLIEPTVYNLEAFIPLYTALGAIGILFVLASGYLLTQSYRADLAMGAAMRAEARGDIQVMYEETAKAVTLNKFIEQYRISFSRLNAFIANNLLAQSQKKLDEANKNLKEGDKKSTLSEQEKQDITSRLYVAIEEGKAATTLNPYKTGNWDNLTSLYTTLLPLSADAKTYTIAAYQRAIFIDPANPVYTLNLGNVYYSLGDYANAQKLFEQTINLKDNWPNAYYNFAWASYQKKDYQLAVAGMQTVLSLLDPKKQSADFKKAEKDLEEFKKNLPAEDTKADSSSTKTTPTTKGLNLPSPVPASNGAQITLPKDASPEAR